MTIEDRAEPRLSASDEAAADYFPHSVRVLYEHAPMKRAVCQVKFPRILKIDSALPADFQESVRGSFPIFGRMTTPSIDGLPPEVMKWVSEAVGAGIYLFRDPDGHMQLTLTGSSLSLTVNRPTRWEVISEALAKSLDALVAIYSPAYFSRVGVR